MVCLKSNATRVRCAHWPSRATALPPRVAPLLHRVGALGRYLAAACVAAVGAVHAASNVVEYTYDAGGNIVAVAEAAGDAEDLILVGQLRGFEPTVEMDDVSIAAGALEGERGFDVAVGARSAEDTDAGRHGEEFRVRGSGVDGK